ncbi:ATP-binding protein [Actinomadura monticuli]|uniref:Tetratricopeptide repeat protein n=1 Tax=Actinomadura monticuli TaxID=3097367 RepID=A0ABV4QEH5_9ACTN
MSGSVVQAGIVHGGVHVHAGAGRPSVPAQLPASRPYFTDRVRELGVLVRLSDSVRDAAAPRVMVISGVGGVGKTSVALAWLHRVADAFPDGQLYADLRGFSAGSPAAPGEFLGRFLRALGTPPEAVPAGTDEQAAQYRTLTAGRKLIIMLDDAASAAQVRPLLPGRGPSMVVVTSRRRLPALAVDGAAFLPLDPLDEDGAVQLLDRMLGSGRTEAEPQAVRSLATLCGRLPLALCTSAARLATRGHWRIERLVGELADERNRLAGFGEEDLSVQAVFDVTYRDLPPSAARLYRLLSVHPNGRFALPAVTALEGGDPVRDLDVLVDVNLVDASPDGTFSFHDLAHVHARTVAERNEPAEGNEQDGERARAFHRLMEHYLRMAVAADRTIIPDRWHLGREYDRPPIVPFSGTVEAIGWMEGALPTLRDMIGEAHRRGLHRETWEMCEALWGVVVVRKHYAAWVETHETGLASATALGDPLAVARMLESLASARLNLGEFAEAERLSREALVLERAARHADGEASALERLGVAQLAQGRVAPAIETFTEALDVSGGATVDPGRGVAMMTRRLGEALLRAGRPAEAAGRLRAARDFFAGRGDDYNLARTLTALADALIADGEDAAASAALDDARDAAARVDARHSLATVHAARARLAERRNDPAAERDHLERAAAIYDELGSHQARAIRDRLLELGGT